jgi:hypothetical protein
VTDLHAPTQLGPYQLRGLIGAGGMGEVHRAVDTAHDGRLVALKLLPPELAQDPERRTRFQRESSIVAALTEPHVIGVHRYGEIDGRLFLDMQLVDGPDLAAHLIANGPMPPEYAVAVVEQIAGALDAAHAAGLVHYDVKPSNVLVHRPAPGRVPHVVLADFGVAGDPDGLGTAEYLAPERWNALPGDGRVDVYALACVLHELLTGTRAFQGAEFAAQMHGHLLLPPPRPSTVVPGLPAPIDAVVATGMAKDPAQRVATAGQLAGMARAALTPARRGPTRRQLLVGAVAGIATLGGGLAVATTLRPSGGGSRPERITPDRVLGIGSTQLSPFRLGAVGGVALAVVIDDSASGLEKPIQAWDLVADQAVGVARTGSVNGIAYLAHQLAIAEVDGRGLLCSANAPLAATPPYEAVIADLVTGQQLGTVPVPKPQSVTFTAGGGPAMQLLDADGGLSRVDLTTRTVTATAPPVPEAVVLGTVHAADVGGTQCAVVVGLGTMAAFDAASLAKVAEWPWSAQVAITVDGRPLGLGIGNGSTLAISPPREQPRLIELPGGVQVTGGVVDGRGIAAVGLRSGEIALYDVVSGDRLNVLLTGHQAKVTQLEVVNSGDRPLLVSAAADNTIRVWDLAVHAYPS